MLAKAFLNSKCISSSSLPHVQELATKPFTKAMFYEELCLTGRLFTSPSFIAILNAYHLFCSQSPHAHYTKLAYERSKISQKI